MWFSTSDDALFVHLYGHRYRCKCVSFQLLYGISHESGILCKLQVSFRKRATNSRALLRKMTYKHKTSYASSIPFFSISHEWSVRKGFQWVLSHKDESRHARMSHVTQERVTSCTRLSHVPRMACGVYRKASDGVLYHHMLVALGRVRDRELVQGMTTRTGYSGPWGVYTPSGTLCVV